MKTKLTKEIQDALSGSYRPLVDLDTLLFERGSELTKAQLLILSKQLVGALRRACYDNDETQKFVDWLLEDLQEEGFVK
jgi:hypothetical protein